MNAEIITIGDELLIGQVVDTNSAFLAAELNQLGISVIRITSIPDVHPDILNALDQAAQRAGLVILTGGLGPTGDDITKPALAEYFGTRLVEHPQLLENLRSRLSERGIELNEYNLKLAEVPEDCELLPNSAGSAPGMWFKRNDIQFISLPGVPFEMKAIFTEEMAPRIRDRFNLPPVRHITLLTQGVPESQMAQMIGEWESNLPDGIKLAYLPSPGILRLRITGKSPGREEDLKSLMEQERQKLEAIISPYIFGYDEDTLEGITGQLLKEHGFTVSVAESCTGGSLGARITSVPGASAYFKGGVIAYSNEIKTSQLNVSPYTLMISGAVSQMVVEQMADGVRIRYGSDFSVSVSGVAGPDGGNSEKPVGTTWIAVASKKRVVSKVFQFGDNRERNVQRAVIAALFMLKNEILNCL
jgi:nicotinamide-nucleotide amidase